MGKKAKGIKKKKPISYWVERFWDYFSTPERVAWVTLKARNVPERKLATSATHREVRVMERHWGMFSKPTQRQIQRGFDWARLENRTKSVYMRQVTQGKRTPIKVPPTHWKPPK